MTRVLVLDNYDSFVFNLVQYLGQLGAETLVRRSDALVPGDVSGLGADGVLISPGPGVPERAGCSVDLVRWCAAQRVPLLGVCLGHQALAVAFGGSVSRASELLHGKTSQVHHQGAGVLAGLPNPFTATRYHSLAVDEAALPDELEVTARTASGVVMGLRHRSAPFVQGVQFHPESVLTEGGHLLLANWLGSCGDASAVERVPALAGEVEALRVSAFG